jgi:HAD superfamily hydrolase (TIGR01509 family)
VRTAILDIDGTLVDTNYQHALAWFRAFARAQIVLPIWRIHRHIGMGGDQLVQALAGEDVERQRGDELRTEERARYAELIGEVRPTEGARELVAVLRERGDTAVLASSARSEEVEHYVDLLDVRELANAWTSSDDVHATKPQPDLIEHALQRAGCTPQQATMVGDSTWDVEAAARAGVETIAVMTGGFSEQELRDAGARAVYESVAELRGDLDRAFRDAGR